jgi:hypothetical protein
VKTGDRLEWATSTRYCRIGWLVLFISGADHRTLRRDKSKSRLRKEVRRDRAHRPGAKNFSGKFEESKLENDIAQAASRSNEHNKHVFKEKSQ